MYTFSILVNDKLNARKRHFILKKFVPYIKTDPLKNLE